MSLLYKKISELDPATEIEVGVDLLELVQGGSSKKVTISKLVDSNGDPILTLLANKRVGVNTDTPSTPLEINGEARLTSSGQMGSNDASLATKKYVDDMSAVLETEAVSISTAIGDGVSKLYLVTTGAGTITMDLPAAASNVDLVIGFKKADTGLGKVVVDGNSTELIELHETNELWTQGELLIIKSNGTKWEQINSKTWHYLINPGTGYISTKTSGWTADRFTSATGGLEVDWSAAVPAGTIAVEFATRLTNNASNLYGRQEGNTNISNTPSASNEHSTLLARNHGSENEITKSRLNLSTDYKTEFAITDTATDLEVSYPFAYFK